MSNRYERINTEDDDDARDIHGNRIHDDYDTPVTPTAPSSNPRRFSYPQPIPNSPPPSFHSVVGTQPPRTDSALEDSFDAPSDDDDEDGHDMRNRRSSPNNSNNSNTFHESIPLVQTSTSSSSSRLGASAAASASIPTRSITPSGRVIGNSNDGVFANISAKPSVGDEKADELPPSYEQAAADAPPPFWETTILAPGMTGDEVYIEGLPLGSFFAFLWNAIISMSFQLVGFLLTYLLHTTHAAKNGSKAGLGITFIQYGFYMRSRPDDVSGGTTISNGVNTTPEVIPNDPNNYSFDAGDASGGNGGGNADGGAADAITQNEWLSYIFMIVGWFVLIKALADYMKARKTEALILASPERAGLGVTIVVDEQGTARAV